MNDDFVLQKPSHHFLSTLVDYYFYIDIPVNELYADQEYVFPFPRITFGYFFDHPFLVTNHDLNEACSVDMVISRISTQKISVQPQSDRVKIIGAHVRPYTLAYLTEKPVSDFPWLIDTVDLFQEKARSFKHKINLCQTPQAMFDIVEKIFLENLLKRNLKVITEAVQLIEKQFGDIKLSDIAEKSGVSERTLRNQFYQHIGCSPKEYIQLVKLKRTIYQMRFSDDSLTDISYDSNYFDQAHFIHSFKQITGRTPKTIQKEISNFRFLQF